MDDERQALALEWACGLSGARSHIVNLSTHGHNDRVAYAAAHTAVIYDKRTRRQTFLQVRAPGTRARARAASSVAAPGGGSRTPPRPQGHCTAIIAIAVSEDRALLVTADGGADSLLVVWNAASGRPLRSVARPHAAGVAAVAVAPDGTQLATLSSVDAGDGIALWDLAAALAGGGDGSDDAGSAPPLEAAARTPVPAGDVQAALAYNAADPGELVSNGPRRAYFWRWAPGSPHLAYISPPLRAADFRQAVGDFVASTFVPGTTQALTSTVDGDVVVWDEQGLSAQMGTRASDRRAVKVMRLHGAAINHIAAIGAPAPAGGRPAAPSGRWPAAEAALTRAECARATTGGLVVTGGADGLVRFFDPQLRLCAWFEQLDAGPVACISFATRGQRCAVAEMQMHTFVAPDFMVSTQAGKVLAVPAASFSATDADAADAGRGELLVEAPAAALTDLAAHPLRPELLLLDGDAGRLIRWDLAARRAPRGAVRPCAACAAPADLPTADCCRRRATVAERALPRELRAMRLALSRDGGLAAVGCECGRVLLLQGDSLEDAAALRHTRQPIARLSIASSGRLVAAADGAGQVLLYGLLPHRGLLRWELVGRYHAHHAPVVGLAFGEAPSGATRLFSLGADRRLLEFELAPAAEAAAGLRAAAVLDLCGAKPTALAFAPPLPYFSAGSLDTLLLVADEAFKVRAHNPDHAHGTAAATFLGPTFGGPINRLLPFRSVADGGSWLAWSSAERVVGLAAWPLDGDPRHSMAVIAHPGPVRGMALSFDGRKLVTLGEQGALNVWDVDTAALVDPGGGDALALELELGGAAGGRGGAEARWAHLVGDAALVEELRDLICYAQVAAQPQDTATPYDITGRVPVAALPDLMRAAGVFLSAADVAALHAHVAFLAALAPADDDAGLGEGSGPGEACGPGGAPRPPASAAPGSVDFETFLCLYANHRPTEAVSLAQIEQAFATLGASAAKGALPARRLLELLQQGGDAMGAEELQRALRVLTGAEHVEAALPELVDARTFASAVLGFESE
ncbi:CFAP251 [Scenedesmus sp. PABB004]|nr:CFAP251 [Scenedesmus sp. PABB004]